MGSSKDSSIDKRIVEMRKEGKYILTIHKWLSGWDNFSQLDEQVVLKKQGAERKTRYTN